MRFSCVVSRVARLGVAACVVSACDSATVINVGTPVAPSSQVMTASIALSGKSLTRFQSTGCFVTGAQQQQQPLTLDLSMTAMTTVSVNQVTVRLVDNNGTSTSAQIAEPTLIALFGSPVIPTGATRTFALQPQFSCSDSSPQSVAADVLVVDSLGHLHTVTATSPIGS